MRSGVSARNRWSSVVRRALFHEAKRWPRTRREETMAVCDCHDFAAFASFCRADTRGPFFRAAEAGVDEGSLRSSFLGLVNLRPVFAASASAAAALPMLETPMTGLIRRIARRQIVQGAPVRRTQKTRSAPHACLPRSPSPIGSSFGTKQQFENRPLGVVRSMFSIYALCHNFQPLCGLNVFMR